MTIDELDSAYQAAIASGLAEMTVKAPGRSHEGKRMRVANDPSLVGSVSGEVKLPDGTWQTTVALRTKDVANYIRRARYRLAFHGGSRG